MRISTLVLGVLFTPAVLANSAEVEPAKDAGWRHSLAAASFHMPRTNLDQGGESELTSYHFQAGAKRRINRAMSLGVKLSYGYHEREFTGSDGFAALEPWGDTTRVGFTGALLVHSNGGLSYGLRPFVNTFSETGDLNSDTLSYGTGLAVVSRLSRDHRLGIGARLSREIDGSVGVKPFVLVDWRFNEHWELRNPSEPDVVGAAGLELNFKPNDDWRIAVAGVYHSTEFRLDDQGVAPAGIGKNSGLIAFLRVDRKWSSGLEMKGYLGATFNGKLEVEDAEGRRLARTDYDTMPLAGLALEKSF